ncbi:hypothetical protein ICN84_10945 [Akkermansia glycaniphila]|uniref:hypothetical protein n=1 Tax=Akkermansia glycaniphila TaxID=1679444 RepID=UPI001C03A0A1|nr:hypothetical protein [Akkermansia glycaniphila]MBT9450584.1 hypothetical protein [Akkermansia glycaniphila]
MSPITHHIPVTTGQAHHMTLRLVQSYGAPAALSDYTVYGSILQDGETVPVSATGEDASGILLTIPPLYPGSHSYNLHLKHKTSGTDYLFLQGNCDVSELIGPDTLDNTAVEQITVALKDDLSGVTVTVQIDSETTAAAWEEIEAVARKTEGLQETISNLIPEARIEIAQATGIAKNDIATATATSLSSITQGATSAAETAVTTVTVESANIVQASKQDLDNYTLAEKQVLVSAANKGTQDIATAVTTGTGTINNAVATGKTSIDNYVAATQADFVRKSQANNWSGIQTFNSNVLFNGDVSLTASNLGLQTPVTSQYGAIIPYMSNSKSAWVPLPIDLETTRKSAASNNWCDVIVYKRQDYYMASGTLSYMIDVSLNAYPGHASVFNICWSDNPDPAIISDNPVITLRRYCGTIHTMIYPQQVNSLAYSVCTAIPCAIVDVTGIAFISYHKSLQWWSGYHGYLVIKTASGQHISVGNYKFTMKDSLNPFKSKYMAIHCADAWTEIGINGGIRYRKTSEYYSAPSLPNQSPGYYIPIGSKPSWTRPLVMCDAIAHSGSEIDNGLFLGKSITLSCEEQSITAQMKVCMGDNATDYQITGPSQINKCLFNTTMQWECRSSNNMISAMISTDETPSHIATLSINVPTNNGTTARSCDVIVHSQDLKSTIYLIKITQSAQS